MAEMNQFVPDFHQVDYGSIPSSSGVCHYNEKNQNKNHENNNNHINFNNDPINFINNNNNEQGLMEMLWSNGQMVLRSLKSPEQLGAPNWEQTAGMCSTSAFPASEPQLFMQEDEMASWLHYPMEEDGRFGGTDLVFPATPAPVEDFVVRGGGGNAVDRIGEAEPPVTPLRMGGELELSSNFSFFNPLGRMLSRGRERPAAEANGIGLGLGDLNLIVPVAHPEAEPERNRGRDGQTSSVAAAEKKEEENNVTADEKKKNKDTAVKKDLKRKGRLEDEEDDKSEATGRSKRARGSSSARRTRAAEVHNLSERKRRDRINEKMKALQELIPHCNKSDKASMLDDAIEYVKQLQRQIQMLSVRNNAMPMVFPDGQAYLAPIGVGMGIGMGMPMPMPMQFPHLGGPSLPRPFGSPPLGPRLPIPAYLPQPTGASLGGSRMPANQPDPLLSHYGVRGLNAMAVPFPGPYPHYMGHYGFQPQPFPPPQARPTGEASTSRGANGEASTSKAGEASTSKGGGGGDQKE